MGFRRSEVQILSARLSEGPAVYDGQPALFLVRGWLYGDSPGPATSTAALSLAAILVGWVEEGRERRQALDGYWNFECSSAIGPTDTCTPPAGIQIIVWV